MKIVFAAHRMDKFSQRNKNLKLTLCSWNKTEKSVTEKEVVDKASLS
jgi:hypothetical protein